MELESELVKNSRSEPLPLRLQSNRDLAEINDFASTLLRSDSRTVSLTELSHHKQAAAKIAGSQKAKSDRYILRGIRWFRFTLHRSKR